MDGVHDIGGLDGLGAIDADNDGVFHHDWEELVFGIGSALTAQGVYNVHEFRYARERIDPVDYLSSPYYDNFMSAVETLLIEKDVVTETTLEQRLRAIETGNADGSVPTRTDPELAAQVLSVAREGYGESESAPSSSPAFDVGTRVRVKPDSPRGHTRVPRYVRKTSGTIDEVHGTFIVPDAKAEGRDEYEPLYSVRFDAGALWGDADTDADAVFVDLWERYLERAPSIDSNEEES